MGLAGWAAATPAAPEDSDHRSSGCAIPPRTFHAEAFGARDPVSDRKVSRADQKWSRAISTRGKLLWMNLDEAAVRIAAINYVHALRDQHDGFAPWDALRAFRWSDRHIPLIGVRGIWKPAALTVPISIATSHKDPYGDEIDGETGLLEYRYFWRKPGDEHHPDNVGLRLAARQGIPLIYFHGVEPGWYQPLAPVVIVGDDQAGRTFTVACDDIDLIRPDLPTHVTEEVRRTYTTQLAVRRLHQAAFRRRVINAYSATCAICRFKVVSLLDAAHIVGDRHPLGDPVIPNGLALCKIHHAAYDQNIVGVRPDAVVEVNRALLHEKDGPMLLHGIQQVHGTSLWQPKARANRPDPERLEIRYDEFRAAS